MHPQPGERIEATLDALHEATCHEEQRQPDSHYPRPLERIPRSREAALEALSGAGTSEAAAARPGRPTKAPAVQAARSRAPRGANRGAVIAAVADRPGTSAGEIAASAGVTRRVVDAQLRQLVAEGLLVKRDLAKIFDFRRDEIERLLPGQAAAGPAGAK